MALACRWRRGFVFSIENGEVVVGRNDFDPDIFIDNPFEGLDATEVYRKLRWGNDPDQEWDIEAPEDMATLGTVARIDFADRREEWDEDEAPFLAVGLTSNMLYMVPRDADGNPETPIPHGPYEPVGAIKRIDYYSNKGDEESYFYHDHEPPYPIVAENSETGIRLIVPADHQGNRSYAVDKEGVIG